jgi:single-strand DNA-binding protein
VNIFSFTGNLGKDCRVGKAGNSTVCNFTVAVKSGFGNNEQTLWVDCALWGKQAESKLPEYLLKGQSVAVSGELGSREHEGKTYLTCNVNGIDLTGSKNAAQAPQSAPAQQPPQQKSPAPMKDPDFDFDDDIPF